MSDPSTAVPSFPTSLGTSHGETINLLGENLADDLMGKVGFGELAYRLITLQRPTRGQVRLFEAVLLALADHGYTPTAIAARLTYLSAPDAIQGAMATGLLGSGSQATGSHHPPAHAARVRMLPCPGANSSIADETRQRPAEHPR